MPPNSIGTYWNRMPVLASIAGITRWHRKAFGLPKSNRNSTFTSLTTSLQTDGSPAQTSTHRGAEHIRPSRLRPLMWDSSTDPDQDYQVPAAPRAQRFSGAQ